MEYLIYGAVRKVQVYSYFDPACVPLGVLTWAGAAVSEILQLANFPNQTTSFSWAIFVGPYGERSLKAAVFRSVLVQGFLQVHPQAGAQSGAGGVSEGPGGWRGHFVPAPAEDTVSYLEA